MKPTAANLLWYLACLPRWRRFRAALRNPAAAQRQVLARLLHDNRDSEFGRRHQFRTIRSPDEFAARVPLAEYDDFAPAIEEARRTGHYALAAETPFLLEPTSGTSGTPKLIPATRASRREFARAVQPWIADLYREYPALFRGRQYWVVSPAAPVPESLRDGAIRVGFSADADYLGPVARRAARHVLASSLDETENLRLISVWHPSYLARATSDFQTGAGARWPRLRLVSCWTDGNARLWAERLRGAFPDVSVQGKGLLATEGCVTIPFQGGLPCAVRSHFLEFIDARTHSVHGVADLQAGSEYSVVLTTGAGLWRCRLHDRVRVTGFMEATPCLEFQGKDNAVSDLVGEKLSEADAAAALAAAVAQTGIHPQFAMLIPDNTAARGTAGYDLFLELAPEEEGTGAATTFAEAVEGSLCATNYHYLNARRLGQLRSLRPVPRRQALQEWLDAARQSGARAGTMKIPALHVPASNVLPKR
ncbi:MAG: GH3 family domain-containing protein [Kiritimatiellia bacterium]|jgi:hypothetical protein